MIPKEHKKIITVDRARLVAGWLVAQAPGIEPLVPSVTRRGYDQCIDWLP